MYLNKDEANVPMFLSRGYRHSLPSATQPSIGSMKSERMNSDKLISDTEVRLPSSTNIIMNEVGGSLTTRKYYKNGKIKDKISESSKISDSKDK